ncbi:MAG TPA: hypothetical protein ENO21_01755 [Firmicutes bacterium]|nr:hypothetical protein [Bacillota bacterium]
MGCRAITLGVALLLLAANLAVALSAAGCAKRVTHEAKLPDDWPVPQLTLPSDIELKAGPEAVQDSSLAPGDRRWVAAFNKDDNWPAFVSHVEGCLKPLDYWRSKEKGLNNPLGLDLPEMRTYYSPDYLVEVVLTHGAYFDAIGPRDIEFAMMVTQYVKPPEHLQLLLKHPNPSIGPKELERIRDAVMEPIT